MILGIMVFVCLEVFALIIGGLLGIVLGLNPLAWGLGFAAGMAMIIGLYAITGGAP